MSAAVHRLREPALLPQARVVVCIVAAMLGRRMTSARADAAFDVRYHLGTKARYTDHNCFNHPSAFGPLACPGTGFAMSPALPHACIDRARYRSVPAQPSRFIPTKHILTVEVQRVPRRRRTTTGAPSRAPPAYMPCPTPQDTSRFTCTFWPGTAAAGPRRTGSRRSRASVKCSRCAVVPALCFVRHAYNRRECR